jgi:hypothetical protein
MQNFVSMVRKTYAFLLNIIAGADTWVHHYESLIESSGMATSAFTLQEKIQGSGFCR